MTTATADRVTADLYELDVDIEIKHRAIVDLPGLIRRYRDEYLAVDLDGGYQEWERPSVFLSQYIDELIDVSLGPDDGKHVHDRSFGDIDIDFRWTSGHYDALLAVCPEADPEHNAPTEADLARRPGPLAVPLPLDGSAA